MPILPLKEVMLDAPEISIITVVENDAPKLIVSLIESPATLKVASVAFLNPSGAASSNVKSQERTQPPAPQAVPAPALLYTA